MRFYFLLSFLFLSILSLAQEKSSQVIEPILIDKSVLSGVGLKPVKLPNEPERKFFQKNVYRGPELSVYVVSSQSWPGKMENFSIDEYVFMLNGRARIRPEGGKDMFVYSREHLFAPKGYTGDWEIQAGDNYHYELSVISTQRADSVVRSGKLRHQVLSKAQLSGLDIKLDADGLSQYEWVHGDELAIGLKGEAPRKQAFEAEKEQIIGLLSGQISILLDEESAFTYHSGDYFILPKGCKGKWQSEGHGLVKYLVIEAAL